MEFIFLALVRCTILSLNYNACIFQTEHGGAPNKLRKEKKMSGENIIISVCGGRAV